MALLGTSTGYVYVLNSFGQVMKSLCCGEEEVMSVASDDDYIAALAFDGVLTVWLKEGYIKWWQVNLVCIHFHLTNKMVYICKTHTHSCCSQQLVRTNGLH